MTLGAEFSSARDRVAHRPELREGPDVDSLAEDFHQVTLRADHASAGDRFDDLKMMETPDGRKGWVPAGAIVSAVRTRLQQL